MKEQDEVHDGTTTILVNGAEIHPDEHPDLHDGRDITRQGHFTRSKVTNLALYKKWLQAEKNPLLNDKRWWYSNDGNIKINLTDVMWRIKELAQMVSEEERTQLMELVAQTQKARGYANGLKVKAFGTGKNSKSGYAKSDRDEILSDQSAKIIELFGRMFSPQEVFKVCVQEWHLACSLKDIVQFRAKHLKAITQKIEEFKRSFDDVRLAIKRGRIEELVWLYTRVKDSYISTGSRSDRDFLLKNLEQLRKETEGDVLKIEGDLSVKVEMNVNVHLQKEIINKLNLTQIIIGRVASRMEKDPLRLIRQMTDSAYNRFNGMTTLQDDTIDAEYEEMKYPSAMPYDFNAIEQIQKQKVEEAKKEETEEQSKRAEEIKKAEEQGGKQFLLDKIKELREINSARAAEVDQMNLDKQVKDAEKRSKTKAGKKVVKPTVQINPAADGAGKAVTLSLLKKAAMRRKKEE